VLVPRPAPLDEEMVTSSSVDAVKLTSLAIDRLEATEIVDLVPLNRTLLGITPASIGSNNIPGSGLYPLGLNAKRDNGLPVPKQVTTLFDTPAVRGLNVRKKGYLVRLGLLTKRYPVRVSIAAIVIALASSGAVVFGTKLLIVKSRSKVIRSPSLTQAAPTAVLKTIASPSPAPPSASQNQRRPFVIESRSPDLDETKPDGKTLGGRKPTSDFALAASGLVQGRYAEARVSYAALAARSSADPTDIALSKLLTRRLSLPCTRATLTEHDVTCPEVIP